MVCNFDGTQDGFAILMLPKMVWLFGQWGNSTANSLRLSSDIQSNWIRAADILRDNSFWLDYVGFWA